MTRTISNVTQAIRRVAAVTEFVSRCLDTEIDMRKNRWFVLFPRMTEQEHIWSIDDRSDAFDLEDDLELHIFERFCFLRPKLPIGKTTKHRWKMNANRSRLGFPNNGLVNRCPKPSSEHCLSNGTTRHDRVAHCQSLLFV
jgi:hypothetical protein